MTTAKHLKNKISFQIQSTAHYIAVWYYTVQHCTILYGKPFPHKMASLSYLKTWKYQFHHQKGIVNIFGIKETLFYSIQVKNERAGNFHIINVHILWQVMKIHDEIIGSSSIGFTACKTAGRRSTGLHHLSSVLNFLFECITGIKKISNKLDLK